MGGWFGHLIFFLGSDAITYSFKYGKVATAADATRAHMWPFHVWNMWIVADTVSLTAYASHSSPHAAVLSAW